ncbi:MAG: M1 family aminopeptidase [Acidobacteriota bacterium]
MLQFLRPACGLSILLCLAASAAHGAGDPTYDALRAARPDGRVVAVSGMSLDRDAFHFKFDSGAFHLLTPVGGRTVGAVFVGHGSYTLEPASETERAHLALLTGNDKLEVLRDEFDRLVLMFYDDTAEELQLGGPAVAGAPLPEAIDIYQHALVSLRKPWKLNLQARLLEDMLNQPTLRSGVFVALVSGKTLPPAMLVIDPLGVDATRLEPFSGGEEVALAIQHPTRGGLWYLSHRTGEVRAGRYLPVSALTDALHYDIESTVKKNADLEGVTTIRFKALVAGLRVLPMYLMPRLRIRTAEFAAAPEGPWTAAAFVQEDRDEDGDASVVLPQALAKGSETLLRIAYGGTDVLTDAGDGSFEVKARESWYPNLGFFADPATFDLRFRVPEKNEVVAVGELVESHVEAGANVSTWKAEAPIRVAGFNYGRFKRLARSDPQTGLEIAVYTNPGTPNIVRELAADLNTINDSGMSESGFDPDAMENIQAPTVQSINTGALAESALVDGMNAARVCSRYFGALGGKRVAITQQSQWNFGQSWPGLVFLPYVSFMNSTLRNQLGITGAQAFIDEVGFHELAHQWWGHQVGWKSYRDTWLSEGFAQFSAALALQHTAGWARYDDHWERARRFIDESPPGNAVPNYLAGPITLGTRLSTDRTPWAAQAIVYYKGAFVLHMLRMMMREQESPSPDAAFMALMQDFAKTYTGLSASTADFQKVAERHMVPMMNATSDGKLDWFFHQWVDGTEIPKLVNDLKVEKQGEEYHVTGSIHQEGVSETFRTLVPVYAELAKGAPLRFSIVPLIGRTPRELDLHVKLPQKPKKITLNYHHEVLTRD